MSTFHSIRAKSQLTRMMLMIIVWVISLHIFVFIRFAGNPCSVNPLDPTAPIDISATILNITRGGIILGIAFGIVDIIFERRVFKVMSYGRLILIKSIAYIFLFVSISLFTNLVSFTIYYGNLDLVPWAKNAARLSWFVPFVYVSLVSILINTLKQIDLKFGPGNLFRLLTGRFHKPQNDHRIFMFMDLKSSTTIAEKLGHIQVSRLIQDCFTDLTIVKDYKAEIYQYVGDEVVISWSMAKGLENLNCIKAYFKFQNLLELKSDFYQTKYGFVPFFKAGLNVGDVTIAEVGQIKREIAFHGDTLNTASRIQEKCNDYKKSLLLSQHVKELIEDHEELQINLEGEIMLRGKAQALKIYSIDEIDMIKINPPEEYLSDLD
jgi:adenylate cyclase